MNKKYWMYKFIFLLSLTSIAEAAIGLSTTHDSVMVVFDPWQLTDPIGCIYIDSSYLSRLSPAEIQGGRFVVDTIRFTKKLSEKNTFRVAITIEGYSGNELVRATQATNFVRMNDDYKYFDDAMIESKLQSFVFHRFTELRQI